MFLGGLFMDKLSYQELQLIEESLIQTKIRIAGILQDHEENKEEIKNHGLAKFITERDKEYKEQLKKIDRLIDKVLDMQIKR